MGCAMAKTNSTGSNRGGQSQLKKLYDMGNRLRNDHKLDGVDCNC
jgi:hypothetical protein